MVTFDLFEPEALSDPTLSAEGSPARTSATPASAQESTASDLDYGASTPELLASYDHDSSSWRTSQLCLGGELSEFSETWPRSGLMRSGIAYRLPPLVRLTDGTESGLLPTPTDASKGGGSSRSGSRINETPTLQGMARKGMLGAMWPTPTVGDSKSSGSRNTPTSKAHAGVSLTDAVRGDGGMGRMVPTPTARDYRHPGRSRLERTGSKAGECLPQAIGGALNPTWVEWLMGFPLGWTALDASVTPSSRKWRKSSDGQ
jgi:hypothetical protein